MEQQFNNLKEIINYLCQSKGKEDTRIRTINASKQIGKIYNESKEEYKEQKMFVLIQTLKYCLVTIKEYKIAYEFYRETLDRQYTHYLKENDELDEYFLFATEVDLICAMKIGKISKELKLMSLMIDVDSMYILLNVKL